MTMTRRTFIAGGGATAAAVAATAAGGRLLGRSSGADRTTAAGTGSGSGGRRGPLVLIGLYGGNDGLNTVIPYEDPAYRQARPTLGYDTGQVLPLGNGLGLNPKLTELAGLWKSGRLAIVRGVGYPNPNLSHFASMAVWQSANPVEGTGPGWIGRWLDGLDGDPMRALGVGTTLPPLLRGEKYTASAATPLGTPLPGGQALQAAYRAMQQRAPDRQGLAAAVAQSGADLLNVQAQLDRYGNGPGRPGTMPAGAAGAPAAPVAPSAGAGVLGPSLSWVAGLINAGAPTEVFHLSLASFDTHAAEKANHERLLGELDSSLTAFVKEIAASEAGRRTVVMTYSEFGRRPAENASGGTDHGTAAPVLVAGHHVHGGKFYGEEPSLTDLDANGNLKSSVDFRSVYATVLDRVIGADPEKVLGGSFPTLEFV